MPPAFDVQRIDRSVPRRVRASRFRVTAALLVGLHAPIFAATLAEETGLEFSGDRSAPTVFALDAATPAPLGGFSNVLSGTIGASPSTGVDRDYLRIVVPEGYLLTALRVGNQTTVGGGGSFIGLASGATMPVAPNAPDATGLLGWRVYGAAGLNADILAALGSAGNGATGFSGPLPAGDYAVWLQELAQGSFTYRLNFVVSPVPEPASVAAMIAGLATLGAIARRRRPRR